MVFGLVLGVDFYDTFQLFVLLFVLFVFGLFVVECKQAFTVIISAAPVARMESWPDFAFGLGSSDSVCSLLCLTVEAVACEFASRRGGLCQIVDLHVNLKEPYQYTQTRSG